MELTFTKARPSLVNHGCTPARSRQPSCGSGSCQVGELKPTARSSSSKPSRDSATAPAATSEPVRKDFIKGSSSLGSWGRGLAAEAHRRHARLVRAGVGAAGETVVEVRDRLGRLKAGAARLELEVARLLGE